MFKLHFNKTQALFFIIFGIFLFTSFVYSSNPFETPKTCSDIFGNCDIGPNEDYQVNDTCTLDCSGIHQPAGNNPCVQEVYINASSFFPGDAINATCQFKGGGATNYEYIWYSNNSDQSWIKIWNDTTDTSGDYNRSVIFNLNRILQILFIKCIE